MHPKAAHALNPTRLGLARTLSHGCARTQPARSAALTGRTRGAAWKDPPRLDTFYNTQRTPHRIHRCSRPTIPARTSCSACYWLGARSTSGHRPHLSLPTTSNTMGIDGARLVGSTGLRRYVPSLGSDCKFTRPGLQFSSALAPTSCPS